MRKLIVITVVVFCATLLAGCHSRSASLTFTPSALGNCSAPNAPSVVKVHWDASSAKLKHGVKVWINNSKTPQRRGVFGGDPGTLWVKGADKGEASTGNWVFPWTTFYVTDASNGDVLAKKRVPVASCH